MTGLKMWNKALWDVMEERASDDFLSFMEAPGSPLLTPAELEQRVARVMSRIDAAESSEVEVCVEGERLWLRATLKGVRVLGEHFIRTIGMEPEPAMIAVRRMTSGAESEPDPAVAALLGTLEAGTIPEWLPVDLRGAGDRSYRLTLRRTTAEVEEPPELRLNVHGTATVPSSVNWPGNDHVEIAFRHAAGDLTDDASLRIDVEMDRDGCLTINLSRTT